VKDNKERSMKYRLLGKTGRSASVLGFGCMRFPVSDGMDDEIMKEESAEMLYYAINHGINYLDTAYPYHGGKSEQFLGEILENGYREKVMLVTKMPCWLIKKTSDFDRYLDIQLKRLRTDYIDFYLLHGIFYERWLRMKDMGVFEWSEKARVDGRIRGFGFSFHDSVSLFKEVIDAYNSWDICQIQYNYLNEDVQAGTEGLLYAASCGVPVVVMEPLFGGALANPSGPVKTLIEEAGKNPVDLALQWLWDKPEVNVVLSGMSSLEQVKQNIVSAGKYGSDPLCSEDRILINRIKNVYSSLNPIPCTKCRYCMPCPAGVDIPRNLELYNQGMCQNLSLSKALYSWHLKREWRADSCIQCGTCEEKCPQHIPIMKWMKDIHDTLFIKE
jgi:predicted aldo/keto reductase-like oxidoreductase